MKNHDTTRPNTESEQAVNKQSCLVTSTKSKFSPAAWVEKVYRPSYTRDGRRFEVLQFWCQIQHEGRRKQLPLSTNDRQQAARRAAHLYQRVKAAGWEAALAEFSPDRGKAQGMPTLGQFLTAAQQAKAADVSPRTLRDYAGAVRRLVALAFGLKDTVQKYNYRTGGRAAWMAKIDRIRLDRITAARLQAAVNKEIAESRGNPIVERQTRFTFASFVRQAKALFAADLKGQFPDAPNPFAQVTASTPRPPRYQSTIDAGELIRAARAELKETYPEAYKAFLLAIGAGLRKGEIDNLQWQHIDNVANTIRVATTETFRPKTDDSENTVFVDAGLISELESFRESASSLYVLESKLQAKPAATFGFYRAEKTFDRLAKWLRQKGMMALKPLHSLRKEFGSLVNATSDIHTASRQLRHSGIGITSAYYADNRRRVAPAIGAMLGTEPETKDSATLAGK